MSDNSKVAKNTLFLYTRTIVTVCVSLYATRVVLETLGVTDYGVYNVIGGFVAMFTFLISSMSGASTRFFAFELGRGNIGAQLKVFRVMFSIYLLFIAGILLVAETVGLWFVARELVIPPERHAAAMAVYQYSVLAMVLSVLRIPYNSVIIAHEEMGFFAYMSVAESLLKLLIVFMLLWIPADKLVLYAALTALVTGLATLAYVIYARRFAECRAGFDLSRDKVREILGFSGWNLVGNVGDILVDQGMNIMLNLVFGPIVNAARAIAYNVKSILINFITNFQLAANPQITMHYAAERLAEMNRLVVQTTKISFFLMLVLVAPAFFSAEWVLNLWLPEVPPYTVLFTRLLLLELLLLAMGGTFHAAVMASGRIRGIMLLLTVPKILLFVLAWPGLRYAGFPPEFVIWLCVFNSALAVVIKVIYYRRFFSLRYSDGLRQLLQRELAAGAAAVAVMAAIWYMAFDAGSVVSVLSCSAAAFIAACGFSYALGFDAHERAAISSAIRSRLKK